MTKPVGECTDPMLTHETMPSRMFGKKSAQGGSFLDLVGRRPVHVFRSRTEDLGYVDPRGF